MPTNSLHFESLIQTMRDAVIVISAARGVLYLNSAAKKLLHRDNSDIVSYDLIPEDIKKVAEKIYSGHSQTDGEVTLEINGVRSFLHVHAQLVAADSTDRSDSNKKHILLVLHDVSRLNQLENIRKEFVANVSHELKTPITSIKAAVETLQDGAVNDREVMPKFLDMISRQSDRLNTIIEDLLSLSRLEKDGDEIQLAQGSVLNVISQAISNCEINAKHKNIIIQIQTSGDLRAKMNVTLLEQALVNLVDNAIKYSDSDRSITVSAVRKSDEIEIAVSDNGRGIDAVHLPRIFERFYRVDKARSRNAGGSGLGLSIVKHIAQVHGGRAIVESQPGVGSRFSLLIPAA